MIGTENYWLLISNLQIKVSECQSICSSCDERVVNCRNALCATYNQYEHYTYNIKSSISGAINWVHTKT